jgi:hypothetical protein
LNSVQVMQYVDDIANVYLWYDEVR